MKILSYNIHKGFKAGNRSLITQPMRKAVHDLNPDLVFLQEVVGRNDRHQLRFNDWPTDPQHHYFKSHELQHGAYGQNVTYDEGHHGNAILSCRPFTSEKNIDISVFSFAPRGFLHASFDHDEHTLHCLCVHLGLVEYERKQQSQSICDYVKTHIPAHAPLLIVGDFNDWRQRLSPHFAREIQAKEAFWEFYGSHPRTFPSWMPAWRLDRIYFKNLLLKKAERLVGKPWNRLSDHIPLIADFDFV